ncbi:D-sedoheptulose-7-phosphate isomerase [Endozoicomonas atrinae]|uniref:D-sedoheptulose-7-phosphate isomerase n=1 Tax=Endozoicomonas atrinae TaxID=1333660 RepID=UPI000826DE65|nr:SIS domain-containing protein [Endozoicomonas atrinae]
MISNFIENSLNQSYLLIDSIRKDLILIDNLNQSINSVIKCFNNNGKLMFAGNGGSAADAQHMSAEFVSRFNFNRPGLPSIALTTDTSALTAIGNDYGFEYIFSRQIEAVGMKNDILIAYSTSGTSPNILNALHTANQREIFSIGLTGTKEESETMASLCNICLRIPHKITANIQEGHLILGHILCGAVEDEIFAREFKNDK